ncbi:probetacellulin [Sardina pilchardus]|uniref:probetacellulin n=1 Tax=Sardina pilchardus TaxID=27697 RepID=UPI002E139792
MERPYKLIFVLITAIALCKYSQAEWNATKASANKTVSCTPHDNSSNCAVTKETHTWNGHFSKCPEKYKHYCIHGMCRFVTEQNTPSCRCASGYTGSRCEYYQFDWLIGDKRQIIIACVIAGLVLLIILLVFICVCTHRPKLCRKKKRREENKEDEIEKLRTIISSEASAPASETVATNEV